MAQGFFQWIRQPYLIRVKDRLRIHYGLPRLLIVHCHRHQWEQSCPFKGTTRVACRKFLPLIRQAGLRGYRYDGSHLEAIVELPELEKSLLLTGTTRSTSNQNGSRMTVCGIPVKLRGQTLGVISLRLKEGYSDDTVSTVQLASERLASALESARLYEEARLRADHEQSVAQITSAISASSSIDEILQTTIRQIGNSLRDTEITIQITGDTKENQQNG